MTASSREEHDLLGTRAVPADAYFGIHTLRARENFPITTTPIGRYPELVVALALIKQAAAATNLELGLIDARRADAIDAACIELRDGKLHDQFVVSAIQGGAGTSTNMNANEVIANRGLEVLGHAKGEYHYLHPLDHVNLSQSTNDVYPTAVKMALWRQVEGLLVAVAELRQAFEAKTLEFEAVLKMGRTQLQDAVPMTLGQEFSTYAATLAEDEAHLRLTAIILAEISLGATAIGTGINADPGYAPLVRSHLERLSGMPVVTAPNLVEATQDTGAYVQLSGTLKRIAVKLSKICNDLRLLSSGPRAGLGELNLPAVQAGSSIMPGKVNPVIPEVVNQVAFEVIGNDVTVTMAAEAGQLQLNAFEPIIAHSLFKSVTHMRQAVQTLTQRCVTGITANPASTLHDVETSVGLATALTPIIGYEAATAVAIEAHRSGRGVIEIVVERGLLDQAAVEALLDPALLTRPQPLRPRAPELQ